MRSNHGSINIVTLGCSKNLVDSEYLLQQLKLQGYQVFHDEVDFYPDTVILNTCGFILDAKQESIDHILQYVAHKEAGHIRKVLVMGCLSERYREELEAEIPEVDGFFGVWDHKEILQSVGAAYLEEHFHERELTTPDHYAFLKISEGCNRQCAFCAIPGIRGKQRSRSVDDLYKEAIYLAGQGVKELILIAQDLTNYGADLPGGDNLFQLITRLADIESIRWIRLHYAYPTGFPSEVIDLMAKHPKICRYLDIPIQHMSSRILKKMRRGHDRNLLEELLLQIRERVPGVAVRTTILVGFPGETEEEFEELKAFISQYRFDRLGVFPYSHEEDTPAANLEDDIPDEIKQARVDELMTLQQQISLEINKTRIGTRLEIIIDRIEEEYYIGRTEFDSPEVDNEVLISREEGELQVGRFYWATITDASEFDLTATIEKG